MQKIKITILDIFSTTKQNFSDKLIKIICALQNLSIILKFLIGRPYATKFKRKEVCRLFKSRKNAPLRESRRYANLNKEGLGDRITAFFSRSSRTATTMQSGRSNS